MGYVWGCEWFFGWEGEGEGSFWGEVGSFSNALKSNVLGY